MEQVHWNWAIVQAVNEHAGFLTWRLGYKQQIEDQIIYAVMN